MTQTAPCECGCASANVTPETVDALKSRVKDLEAIVEAAYQHLAISGRLVDNAMAGQLAAMLGATMPDSPVTCTAEEAGDFLAGTGPGDEYNRGIRAALRTLANYQRPNEGEPYWKRLPDALRAEVLETHYLTAKECLAQTAADRDLWKKGCLEWQEVGTLARARVVELETAVRSETALHRVVREALAEVEHSDFCNSGEAHADLLRKLEAALTGGGDAEEASGHLRTCPVHPRTNEAKPPKVGDLVEHAEWQWQARIISIGVNEACVRLEPARTNEPLDQYWQLSSIRPIPQRTNEAVEAERGKRP